MDFSSIELPSNKKFGFFFSGVFLTTGLFFLFSGELIAAYVFLVLTALFFIIALIKPNILLPLNQQWMRLGFFLGMIVSPCVLGLIFFLLFTPIALLMRLFGRDELRLGLNTRNSYWIKRCTPIESGSFKQQF